MVIAQLTGGMGNQMFQYAFARYLSIKNQTELYLDTSILLNHLPCGLTQCFYDLDIFNHAAKIGTERDFPQYTTKYHVKFKPARAIHLLRIFMSGHIYYRQSQFNFLEKYHHLPKNVYLDGYWQSEKFFKPIEDTIRKDFTFNFEPKDRASNLLNEIKASNAVCVHIRRGDYLRYIAHHGVVGAEYILKGIDYISNLHPDATFYIFSNDITWCIEHIKPRQHTVYITDENAGPNFKEHFYLMTRCKHFIIANSTFSWWAAYLAQNENKIVIAPKQWVVSSQINTQDILPNGWLKF